MDFATVFTGFNLADAQLVHARLEAAGFHPVVINEYTAGAFGGGANAISPVSIQVPEAEAADAKEFLAAP
jgi:uncharacterized protein YjbI with pentapeptide repeats